jgi:hypothetical protein
MVNFTRLLLIYCFLFALASGAWATPPGGELPLRNKLGVDEKEIIAKWLDLPANKRIDKEKYWKSVAKGEIFYGEFDLDEDGVNEVFLVTTAPGFCGTLGCAMEIIKRDRDKVDVICETIAYHRSLYIFRKKTNGYRTYHNGISLYYFNSGGKCTSDENSNKG